MSAYVVELTVPDSEGHRMLVGPFPTYGAAEDFAIKLPSDTVVSIRKIVAP